MSSVYVLIWNIPGSSTPMLITLIGFPSPLLCSAPLSFIIMVTGCYHLNSGTGTGRSEGSSIVRNPDGLLTMETKPADPGIRRPSAVMRKPNARLGECPCSWVRKSRSQHLAGKLTWPHSGGSWSFAFLSVSVAMWLIPENLQHNHLRGDHFRRYPQSCVGLWCGVCDLIICSCVLWSSAAEACGPSFLSSGVCSGSQVASSEPAQLYGACWGSP